MSAPGANDPGTYGELVMELNEQILAVVAAALADADAARSRLLTAAATTLINMRNEKFPDIPQAEVDYFNGLFERKRKERGYCLTRVD